MKAKTAVRAREIVKLNARRKEINDHSLDEIAIIHPNGNKIIFSDEFIHNWSLTGLNITDLELVLIDEEGNIKTEIGMEVWKRTTK